MGPLTTGKPPLLLGAGPLLLLLALSLLPHGVEPTHQKPCPALPYLTTYCTLPPSLPESWASSESCPCPYNPLTSLFLSLHRVADSKPPSSSSSFLPPSLISRLDNHNSHFTPRRKPEDSGPTTPGDCPVHWGKSQCRRREPSTTPRGSLNNFHLLRSFASPPSIHPLPLLWSLLDLAA